MFQFAAARALAHGAGGIVGVDVGALDRGGVFARASAGRDTARSYMLDRFNLPQPVRRRSRAYGRLRRWLGRETIYREPHFHYDPAFQSLKGPVTLSGYFQSERYFAAIADAVRAMYTLAVPLSPTADATLAAIANTPEAVAVHVRRGDYITNPAAAAAHTLLDADYYRRALTILRERLGREPDVFLFSDEPDQVAEVLPLAGRQTLVRGHADRPWEDLALMARCRHHIIANSSFSWWGAWLAKNPTQAVIAPRDWFKGRMAETNNLKDFYPAGWVVI